MEVGKSGRSSRKLKEGIAGYELQLDLEPKMRSVVDSEAAMFPVSGRTGRKERNGATCVSRRKSSNGGEHGRWVASSRMYDRASSVIRSNVGGDSPAELREAMRRCVDD